MKRTLISLLALAVTMPLCAQQAAPVASQADPGSRPVASINGETLTAAQLDALFNRIPGQVREQYEQNGGKMSFLDNYIRKRLLIQEAIKHNFDKQPDVQSELNQARDAALFDRYVRDTIASQIITDNLLHTTYEAAKSTFAYPESVKVRHIITTGRPGSVSNTTGSKARTEEEAKTKIERIRGELFGVQRTLRGQPEMKKQALVNAFARAAEQFSEDGTAERGGDLGWVAPGKLDPTFEDVALHLEPGQMSGVIQTKFGYHIILVEGRQKAGISTFEEVRSKLREAMVAEKAAEIIQAVTRTTNELRTQSKVTLYPENVK